LLQCTLPLTCTSAIVSPVHFGRTLLVHIGRSEVVH
jgi:hypothetical protein